MATAVEDQENILKELLKTGKDTEFGKEHHLDDVHRLRRSTEMRSRSGIMSSSSPISTKLKKGKHNVLWKGKPIYLAKTSGTTSGVKYIPITKDSISNHINTARNALLCYIAETGNSSLQTGK